VNAQALQDQLLAICEIEGLIGCAVVDIDTGMALKASGSDEVQHLCECASDFWRLHSRNAKHYSLLGGLTAQVLIQTQGRVTMVRCPGSLLLVCVSSEPDKVNWSHWKARLGELNQLVAA
jgi:hypothetical protein